MCDNAASESDSSKRARVSSVTNPYLKKPVAAVRQMSAEGSASGSVAPSVASLPASPPPQDVDSATKPDASDTATTPTQEKPTFGEKEPAVGRLPSRNVSFGSAEILTVTELHQHASLYVDRSVRITGLVLHRQVASDGNVCLVLKDPSIQKTTTKAVKSILKTPGIKRRSLGVGGRSTTPRFVTRKRPLSSLKKAPPPPAVNPIETMVASLVEQPAVLVYTVSKQMPVNDATVGDLVMIIGEMQTTPVAAVQPIVETWNEKTNSTSNSFVHARILRNVNGTDMRLHDEALRMRRQHLIEIITTESNQGETLRTGCGPPPYYNANDDNKEMSV